MKSLKDLEYNLELDKVAKKINKNKAGRVLLQFPDGLKQYACLVVDELEKKTKAEFFIWFESCFGACDVPVVPENLHIDLVVSFGHSPWIQKH